MCLLFSLFYYSPILLLHIFMFMGILLACMSEHHMCAIPPRARRGCWFSLGVQLQIVLTYLVRAGNWTLVLWESNHWAIASPTLSISHSYPSLFPVACLPILVDLSSDMFPHTCFCFHGHWLPCISVYSWKAQVFSVHCLNLPQNVLILYRVSWNISHLHSLLLCH